jgi:hypothetical protein
MSLIHCYPLVVSLTTDRLFSKRMKTHGLSVVTGRSRTLKNSTTQLNEAPDFKLIKFASKLCTF